MDSLRPLQKIGVVLIAGVALVTVFGAFYAQREAIELKSAASLGAIGPTGATGPAGYTQQPLSPAPKSPEKTVEEAREATEAREMLLSLLGVSEPTFILQVFDTWLAEVPSLQMVLMPQDLEAQLGRLVDACQKAGVPEKEIRKRQDQFEKIRSSSKA